jgi:hypothetical protein
VTRNQRLILFNTQTIPVPSKIREALARLAEAYDYARATGRDLWEFAVEMPELLAAGLTTSDLRWLVSQQYVEHAREVTQQGDSTRKFTPSMNLALGAETCFALSAKGAAAASAIQSGPAVLALRSAAEQRPSRRDVAAQGRPRPHWDAMHRVLRLGDRVVKRFRVPAANQEMVLKVFHEENWAYRISDPLPPLPDQDPKQRLHDTIKCLNRNQTERLISFRGDGTGEGVVWELVDVGSLVVGRQGRKLRSAA